MIKSREYILKHENFIKILIMRIFYHIGDAPEFDKTGDTDYKGHGELGRILERINEYEIIKNSYRGKLERNYLQALEMWDGGMTAGTLYTIVTGAASSVGSIIGSVAAAGLGVGVSVGMS